MVKKPPKPSSKVKVSKISRKILPQGPITPPPGSRLKGAGKPKGKPK